MYYTTAAGVKLTSLIIVLVPLWSRPVNLNCWLATEANSHSPRSLYTLENSPQWPSLATSKPQASQRTGEVSDIQIGYCCLTKQLVDVTASFLNVSPGIVLQAGYSVLWGSCVWLSLNLWILSFNYGQCLYLHIQIPQVIKTECIAFWMASWNS